MLKLNDLTLILDNLLVTINHKKRLWIHFFKKSSFIIQEKFVLCHLLLHCVFKLVELLVSDDFSLLLSDLIYFGLDFSNVIFFFFDLHDYFLYCLKRSLCIDLFNFILDFFLYFSIIFIPNRVLILDLCLKLISILTWLLNWGFKVTNFLSIIARIMVTLNALSNVNFTLNGVSLILQFLIFFLNFGKCHYVILSFFILINDFLIKLINHLLKVFSFRIFLLLKQIKILLLLSNFTLDIIILNSKLIEIWFNILNLIIELLDLHLILFAVLINIRHQLLDDGRLSMIHLIF